MSQRAGKNSQADRRLLITVLKRKILFYKSSDDELK